MCSSKVGATPSVRIPCKRPTATPWPTAWSRSISTSASCTQTMMSWPSCSEGGTAFQAPAWCVQPPPPLRCLNRDPLRTTSFFARGQSEHPPPEYHSGTLSGWAGPDIWSGRGMTATPRFGQLSAHRPPAWGACPVQPGLARPAETVSACGVGHHRQTPLSVKSLHLRTQRARGTSSMRRFHSTGHARAVHGRHLYDTHVRRHIFKRNPSTPAQRPCSSSSQEGRGGGLTLYFRHKGPK
mmetsp:Transcript_26167/g.47149  ORF Transcript_26167/g.47149 Transcript_26167/m.47149 type:complete len:239 (+) Transcript_26167:251-967(+)